MFRSVLKGSWSLQKSTPRVATICHILEMSGAGMNPKDAEESLWNEILERIDPKQTSQEMIQSYNTWAGSYSDVQFEFSSILI